MGHIQPVFNGNRKASLGTAHGVIHFPTFMPVTTFGEKYPLDRMIQPYLKRLSQCLMVSYYYAQEMKKRPGMPLFVDSGGYAGLFEGTEILDYGEYACIKTKNGDKVKPLDVLHFQIKNADIGATLDFIIPPGLDETECRRRQELTIKNALYAQEHNIVGNLVLFASLQCWDEASARRCARIYAEAGFDGIAIGGMVPRARDKEYVKSIVRVVREAAPNCVIHVFGCGNMDLIPELIAAGADSFDSSSYARRAVDSGKTESSSGMHSAMYAAIENLYKINAMLGGEDATTGKTQKEVAQKMIEALNDINQGCYIAPSKLTLGEWLDTWLEVYVTPSVKPYTTDSYRSACRVHIKPVLGRIKLSALSTLQIQRFYNQLLQDGLSPKTIKNINGVLHKAINQAVRIGELKFNPVDACDLPKVYKKEITPLEQDDIRRFIAAIQGHRHEILYTVTLFTGLRQGEVLGLTWDCVDFDRCTLYINKQLQKTQKVGGDYALVPTKNGRSRLITVAPYVIHLLQRRQKEQEAEQAVAGVAWSNPNRLVFTNGLGGHLVHITVYKEFKEIARTLGYENARFHDLRHSYAVAAIESGDDIKTVQANLGHATASFTLDVYGHASQKMRQRSADRMEQYIKDVLWN